MKWNELKIDGVKSIEKFAAEFDVWELQKTPWAKFKVKIYESPEGTFKGYTNLKAKDENGEYKAGYACGDSIEDTLEKTVINFLDILKRKEKWEEEDYDCVDPQDF